MARIATYPTPIDEIRSFDIAFFKRNKILKPNSTNSGNIIWTNEMTGFKNSISYTIDLTDNRGILTLKYTYRETEEINYKILITSRTANIGNGLLWFFICPHTGKTCRKLHFISGYFLHRTADSSLMYQKQLDSKKMRFWCKRYGVMLDESVYSQLYSKHFKKYYNGKPTKKYLKLIQKIQQIESIDVWEYENSLLL